MASSADPPRGTESSDDQLTILVKSPTDVPGTPALSLSFARNSSILDVKNSLERSHPNHPPTSTQRLIHAGKLLADASKLSDVLTGVTPQVVHLVTPAVPISNTPSTPINYNNTPTPGVAPPGIPAASASPYQAHMREVEAAFQRVLRHQTRYLAMMRETPPASAEATAAELEAVRNAVAAYDESAQRHRAAIRNPAPAVAGGAIAGNVPNVAPFPVPQQAQGDRAWGAQVPAFVAEAQAQAQAQAAAAIPRQAGVAGQAGAQVGPNGHVWRRHLVFQFDLHWGLLLKLALFVFILAQEGSPRRTKMLGALAVFVYFWQTGHLGFVRRLIAVLLPSPTQLFSYLAPSTPPSNAPGNNTNTTSWRLAVALSYVYSFCYGFVCSLLPSWNPESIPNQLQHAARRIEPHQHAE